MRINVVKIEDEKRKNAKRIVVGGIRTISSLQDITSVIEGVLSSMDNVEIFKEEFIKEQDLINNLMYSYAVEVDIYDKGDEYKSPEKMLKEFENLISFIKDYGNEIYLIMPRQHGKIMFTDAMKLYIEREKNIR